MFSLMFDLIRQGTTLRRTATGSSAPRHMVSFRSVWTHTLGYRTAPFCIRLLTWFVQAFGRLLIRNQETATGSSSFAFAAGHPVRLTRHHDHAARAACRCIYIAAHLPVSSSAGQGTRSRAKAFRLHTPCMAGQSPDMLCRAIGLCARSVTGHLIRWSTRSRSSS